MMSPASLSLLVIEISSFDGVGSSIGQAGGVWIKKRHDNRKVVVPVVRGVSGHQTAFDLGLVRATN